jgi:hypothetical protein
MHNRGVALAYLVPIEIFYAIDGFAFGMSISTVGWLKGNFA